MTNNQNTTEVWKAIPGWEGLYEASTHGRVRSLDRNFIARSGKTYKSRGRILKLVTETNGYMRVCLSKNSVRKPKSVHRLVLETFVGACPAGMEACHNNGNRADNRLENLRWDTPRQNNQDTIKHGNNYELKKTHCPHGHLLNSPNLAEWTLKRGGRKCLACQRARAYVRNHPELKTSIKQISDSYYTKIMATN